MKKIIQALKKDNELFVHELEELLRNPRTKFRPILRYKDSKDYDIYTETLNCQTINWQDGKETYRFDDLNTLYVYLGKLLSVNTKKFLKSIL